MKIAELRGKTKDELGSLLIDLKKEQLNLRFQRSTGELANTARVRVVRKSVARIKTLLAQADYQPVKTKAGEKAAKTVAKKAEKETKKVEKKTAKETKKKETTAKKEAKTAEKKAAKKKA